MSLRSCLIFLASLSVLAALVGCGGSSNPIKTTGTASTNSQLNGSYAFSISGTDSSSGAPFALTGSFAANGAGQITGGAVDFNDPASGQASALAVTGGQYGVGSDGRGTATLGITTLGNITVDYVLTSSSHGLITQFDKGGSGSGSFDLQTPVTQSSLANSYAFSFAGFDANSSAPFATAGAFTLDATGNITAGVQDSNDNGIVTTGQVTGTVTVGSGSAPGAAQLASTFGTLTFDVYAVDATHLRFVETDSTPILSGDAFTQQSALPSGATVFTLGGLSSSGALAAGGLMTFNSDGTVGGGSEDANISGTVIQQAAFTGTYSALSGGRSVLNLSGFTPAIQFAVYPSSGGMLMLETDNLALSSGTALAQTATTFSTSGGYGFNFSGFNTGAGVEVDDIAGFTATSSALTGTIDENDEGSISSGKALSGTYTASVGGRGTLALQGGSFNADYYVANSSTVLFIETDAGQVGTGAFLGQSGVGASAAAILHGVALQHPAAFHSAVKQKVSAAK